VEGPARPAVFEPTVDAIDLKRALVEARLTAFESRRA
jgi:hypothetical protein